MTVAPGGPAFARKVVFRDLSPATTAGITSRKHKPGKIAIRKPISRAVVVSTSGVFPFGTTLSRQGPATRAGTAASSSSVRGASTNATSAPAASAALAPINRFAQPSHGASVGTRDQNKILTATCRDCGLDLRDEFLAADDVFAVKMSAPL